MECPECGEDLDFLDYIAERTTGRVKWELYICHNEDCGCEGWIYHDRNGEPVRGDPSGCY